MTFRKAGEYPSFTVDSVSVAKVFGWMFYGLFLTFGTALGLFLSAANGIITKDYYFGLILGATVGYLVFSIIAIIIMSFSRNKVLSIVVYSIYALLLGGLLSSIFVQFEIGTVVYALGVTSLVFGVMALYGYFTKRDLTGFASVLFMILMGVLILSFINLILFFVVPDAISGLSWILSYVVLGVIIGYVAVDVQRVKRAAECGALSNSLPIFLAFNLYTDFIYIFIRVLIIIGNSRR